ncbi:hypothetical protein [Streptomyces sp. NBC_00525]|uniref:hypothetical protein n=1 Tax=Streptomyces sp. NBC_00525 TaxID=2903660 RepID=UPI002E8013DB|nr:hypothetical protein [Streptomyces sp. NBC_00525]WUC97423.1 hypothetical protein OG710_29085 [Streptomyces sp. NBC_00525]
MADQYPQIAAGDELTAELLMSMLPRIVNKPSSTTRTSTITTTLDPDLQMELEANATYFVEFYIHYAALAAEGFKTDWTVPTGTTGNKCVIGMASTASDADADESLGRFGVHNFSTDIRYGTRDHVGNQAFAYETATVVTSASGVLGLNWTQTVAGTSGTTVFNTSLMRVTRLA